MNYRKIYNSIIERAKTRTLTEGIYTEDHHFIPKCMGGIETVPLTAKEHFICHHLLTKIYPSNRGLWFALKMMCTISLKGRRNYVIKKSSRLYQICKIKCNKILSDNMKGMTRSLSTRFKMHLAKQKMTMETKQKMSKSHTGVHNSLEHNLNISKAKKGKKLSTETKIKMSIASKGKPKPPRTIKHIANLVASNKGKKRAKYPKVSEETKLKMSLAKKGRRASEETKLKMSKSRIGKKYVLKRYKSFK